MKSGDLVKYRGHISGWYQLISDPDTNDYADGSWQPMSLGIVLNSMRNTSDHLYLNLLTSDGYVGWLHHSVCVLVSER